MSWEIPPEGDRELKLPVRLVADGHHPRVGLADPAAVVLLLAHVVDDVPGYNRLAQTSVVCYLFSKSPCTQ